MNILTIKQGEWLNKDHTHFRVVGTTDLPGFEGEELELFLTTEDEEYINLPDELKSLIVDKVVPLATLIEEKLKELKEITNQFENTLNKDMYFISSLGFKCDGDRRTKDNLQDLITFFDLQAVNGVILYRDYDNIEHPLTKEAVQILLLEHIANGRSLYNQKWAYQEQINTCESTEQLQALKFNFTMGDFTNEV